VYDTHACCYSLLSLVTYRFWSATNAASHAGLCPGCVCCDQQLLLYCAVCIMSQIHDRDHVFAMVKGFVWSRMGCLRWCACQLLAELLLLQGLCKCVYGETCICNARSGFGRCRACFVCICRLQRQSLCTSELWPGVLKAVKGGGTMCFTV
jgi:hypothetical protein